MNTKQQLLHDIVHKPRPELENVYDDGPLILSPVPENCQKNAAGVILGIDEAGRGPVLGPMTYSAAYWALKDDECMIQKGFNDSKALSKETRKKLMDKILLTTEIGYAVRVLHASEISRNMLRTTPRSLNVMSHDAAIEMIQGVLDLGVRLVHVYIDTVGNADTYQKKLDKLFPGIRFTVEKKADANYAVCSAASIIAKVLRDELTDKFIWSEGKYYQPKGRDDDDDDDSRGYGSGYPSDPKCKKWLETNLADPIFGFPDFVRFSWAPIQDVMKEKGTRMDWEADDDDDDDDDTFQPKMTSFMMASNTTKRKRSDYFENRKMTIVNNLFTC